MTSDLSNDDLNTILVAAVDRFGLVEHHINSMNKLYTDGIRQILRDTFVIETVIPESKLSDKTLSSVHVEVEIDNVRIGKPTVLQNQLDTHTGRVRRANIATTNN